MILDTNALSAFAEGDTKLQKVLASATELYLPSIVLGEYVFGIRQSKYRDIYESWLETSLKLFRPLGVGRETALAYADIRQSLKAAGKPIPENDIWIAAIAQKHKMTLVTRDAHFAHIKTINVLKW